jgi:hypothetical protein
MPASPTIAATDLFSLKRRPALLLRIEQTFIGHRLSRPRAPKNLRHHSRLSLLRDHVLQREPACRGRELRFVLAMHVDEVRLVEFIADHRIPGVP